MSTMNNYFFLRHIKECKRKLKDFDKPKILKNQAKKYIDDFNNFLDSIDTENYSDFDDFNSRVKTFNEELNKILKTNQIDNSDIISIFTNILIIMINGFVKA
ncbi:hypothetical protein [Brachyspira murdochii]|uniref:Uncharacterized protein n=1 Tax=Brachyspira murdochii TaxID=84378 RepID=A0ABX5B7B6_9SPIR|nr:hypothetical protein [Brachyspira murdochii]PPS23201.1 hypothetical protein DJ52_00485 [Brachyspira murdochii]